jgi:hypothetical protein
MTRRERVLGLVVLGALGVTAGPLGARLYLERLRALDAGIAAAEARIARMELALRGARSAAPRGRSWAAAGASPEAFLSGFDRVVRGAGWTTESTIFKGRKDGVTRFSISVAGPGSGWERLLGALDAWDARILIETIEAAASGAGRMRASLEAGYAIE